MQEMDMLKHQLKLISKIETLLDELLTSTQLDTFNGKGFGSFYPLESLKLMKVMQFAITLEMKTIEQMEEDRKSNC